jgi:cytochrome c biogenesis protein CcdA
VRAVAELIESSQTALQTGRLFNLYSKQIEKYQTQTQARAGWSFIFAIIAMVSGLGFLVWGGYEIIREHVKWEHVAAGNAISAIGGAVSAFITKTFLDVHRLSLIQLNHYFRQPVLNAHIPKGPLTKKHTNQSSPRSVN